MWYSGPHLGTPSDIALFEENRPPLMPGEQLLADKAYVKDEWNSTLIAPIKNKKGCIITADQSAFNDIIGWYRASIEHSFGFLKRYRILNSVYRGRIHKNNSALTLSHIIKILIHSDAVYIRYHPHRTHHPIVSSSRCIDLAIERAILLQQQQTPRPIPKKKSNRSKSSSSTKTSSSSSSSSCSSSSSSSSSSQNSSRSSAINRVDTGCKYSDFEIEDVVMAWYNDDFYIATIREKDNTNQLFTFNLEFDDETESSDYEPREIKHLS
jgi:hypothetical protein